MAPDTYLRCLYWFCDDCSYNTARKQARATTKMWSKFVHRLRSILQLAMCRLQDLQGKLGGAGNLVAIDESWMMTKNGFAEAFVEDKPRAPKPQSWAWWKLIWQMFAAGDSRQDGEDFASTCGIMSYPALWFSLMLTLDTDGLPRKTPATCTGASITNRKNFLAPRRSLGCAKSSQATLQRVCLVAWFSDFATTAEVVFASFSWQQPIAQESACSRCGFGSLLVQNYTAALFWQ